MADGSPNKLRDENSFKARRGRGRPKGSQNKVAKAAKEAIADAFEGLGGIDGLIEWASKNDEHRKCFYSQIWPKIVPLQLSGDKDNPLFPSRIELVAP